MILKSVIFIITILIPTSLACTQPELKSAACWALCRQDGFDSGFYKEPDCFCVMKQKFRDRARVKIKLEKVISKNPF